MNTIDGPTKLVRQDAILGGLTIGQLQLDTVKRTDTHLTTSSEVLTLDLHGGISSSGRALA